MHSLFGNTVEALSHIAKEKLEYVRKNPDNLDHDSLYFLVSEINLIELNNERSNPSDIPDTLKVAFWNCERGQFVLDTMKHKVLQQTDVRFMDAIDYQKLEDDTVFTVSLILDGIMNTNPQEESL